MHEPSDAGVLTSFILVDPCYIPDDSANFIRITVDILYN